MSFSDDLANDLSAVFFGDFNDTAVIGVDSVVGFLDVNAYRWASIESNQKIFTAPANAMPELGRGTSLLINGIERTYVRHYPDDDLIRVVVV